VKRSEGLGLFPDTSTRRGVGSSAAGVKPERNRNLDDSPTFRKASSHRAAAQVRQVSHAQALGDFPQPGSAGGEETAQQPACGQLLQPRLPVLGVAAGVTTGLTLSSAPDSSVETLILVLYMELPKRVPLFVEVGTSEV